MFNRPASNGFYMLISNYSKTSYNFSTRSFWLIFAFSLVCISAVFAEDQRAFIRQVRSFESDKIDIRNPSGLAFSPNTNILHVLPQNQPYDQAAEIFRLTLTEGRVGSAGIAAQIKDPINMAFDGRFNRLLILQSPANQLVEVLEDADGNLDPRTVSRHDVRHFGLQDPQGMAVDPASGVLFILDAAVPRILRIEPEADGRFAKAEIATEDLSSNDLVDPRGLAFDPSSGHLHVVNPAEQELYELSQGGPVLSTRNLSAFGFGKLQGMVFAPSGDQTDDPLEMSLYLADSGIVSGQSQGGLSPKGGQTDAQSAELMLEQSSGQIVEMSFTALAAPAASNFTSSLVNTVECRSGPRPARTRRGWLTCPKQPPDHGRWGSGRDRQRHHPFPGRQRLGTDPGRGGHPHRQHLQDRAHRGADDERADRGWPGTRTTTIIIFPMTIGDRRLRPEPRGRRAGGHQR